MLDHDYHLNLFRWREEHILAGVARRLRRGIDNGGEPFDVFNDCQDHVLAAARAHAELELFEAFATAVGRSEHAELRSVLSSLCDLHALAEIERDRAWFQEHGRMSSTRAKMVTRAVNGLCETLREHAAELVDAFGIPDEVLAAPIGLPGGEASRTAAVEIGDELPNVRMVLSEAGNESRA